MSGFFISFEGGEGAGKTSQIQRIGQRLRDKGHEVITTREPGGTLEAEKIRDLLVQRDGGAWDPMSECLLFFTARRMHVETLIKPNLAKGHVVICDRFTDSTVAYQGYGHGFDLETIRKIEALTINSFAPDITFLLDLPPEEGLKRSERRLKREESEEDRFEQLDLSFHAKLRKGFLDIAALHPHRVTKIDALQSLEQVEAQIWHALSEKMP